MPKHKEEKISIGVVAPASALDPNVVAMVEALVTDNGYDQHAELHFHSQCFECHGHFAGSDQQRGDALVELANDPDIDAIWFARGGAGSYRIAERVAARLNDTAKNKTYLGYSDIAYLMSALYNRGFPSLFHGPMPGDIQRDNGQVAIKRALDFLIDRSPDAFESTASNGTKTAAYNISVLSQMIGTPLQPDLTDHVLMLEDIAEHLYRIDRSLFHILSNPEVQKVAGIKLGRCNAIPNNKPDFGQSEEQLIEYWCEQSGIPYLGRADIGHDADNKIVPFGAL